jgi:two-component system sensor histidine kinase ChvG
MSTTAPSTATSNGCARNSAISTTRSIRSRRCTAWGTAIRKSDALGTIGQGRARTGKARAATRTGKAPAGSRPRRSLLLSPIARLILASNLAGLLILIAGALVLNEMRSNLVQARKESLKETSELIGSFLTEVATHGEPKPYLSGPEARGFMKRIKFSPSTRIRIFDTQGHPVTGADTALLNDQVEGKTLPPIKEPSKFDAAWLDLVRNFNGTIEGFSPHQPSQLARARSLEEEIGIALRGDPVSSERFNDRAERVISVTMPIRHVGAVVAVLTLETSDVAAIIAAERTALLPFIIVAILTAVITSTLMTVFIARPLRRLSLASDRVRTGATERLKLDRLHNRKDEIGDLAQAMEAMTAALYDRIQANEQFAADVAHELKNPLTSIRSAVETSQAVSDPAVRDRMRDVIARDVIRLDRLISDISNLSRLEGEIVREKLVRVDFGRLLEDIVSIYRDTGRDGEARVALTDFAASAVTGPHAVIMGREGPLAQVIRNLVENARSFSPPGGEVMVTLARVNSLQGGPMLRLTVEDQGPGIPPDKLEKIFDRFYTDRPQGAKFGNNSGLGLSIVRQIVETHRGRVWAENRVVDGNVAGARFTVDLPPASDV